jgi:hypothetical protein
LHGQVAISRRSSRRARLGGSRDSRTSGLRRISEAEIVLKVVKTAMIRGSVASYRSTRLGSMCRS